MKDYVPFFLEKKGTKEKRPRNRSLDRPLHPAASGLALGVLRGQGVFDGTDFRGTRK
ncbi:MAG: hypothetical protein AB1763_04550 [Campylobacterota bacterium]